MTQQNQLHPWLLLIVLLLSACSGHPPRQEPSSPAPAPTSYPALSGYVLPAQSRAEVASILKVRVSTSAGQDKVAVLGMTLSQGITAFYQHRQYQPAWNDDRPLGQLIVALEDLLFDGLDSSEYSLRELKQKHARLPTLTSFTERAELDLLGWEEPNDIFHH